MKKFWDFKFHSYAIRAEIFLSPHKRTKIRFKKKGKYFLGNKGNRLFFNLKQVSLNSDEN